VKPPAAERTEWDELLDQLERSLGTGEELELPDGLPVMPARLMSRARSILARQAEVVAELAAERERVGAELAVQRRVPRAASAPTGASLSL
jgi:hypothetical protein